MLTVLNDIAFQQTWPMLFVLQKNACLLIDYKIQNTSLFDACVVVRDPLCHADECEKLPNDTGRNV